MFIICIHQCNMVIYLYHMHPVFVDKVIKTIRNFDEFLIIIFYNLTIADNDVNIFFKLF